VCVCSVGSTVEGRLYMSQQLLAAVVAHNVYDEIKDAANENKMCSWLSGLVDWLLSLQSRFYLIFCLSVSLTPSLWSWCWLLLLNKLFSLCS